MRKITAVLLLAAALLLTPQALSPARAAGREYVVALWPLMGSMSKGYNDLMSRIITILFDKMGEKVKIVTNMTQDQAYSALKARKIDATLVLSADYTKMLASGASGLTPVITYADKGHRNETKCMLVRKDSTYQSYEDLRGKQIQAPYNQIEYTSLRWHLLQNKINEPLAKFFGGFLWSPDDIDGVLAVSQGKGDAVLAHSGTINFYRFTNSAVINKLRPIDCFEMPSPGTAIVWSARLDPAFSKKFYDIMSGLNSFPEFKKYKPILDVMKTQLLLVTEKDYDGLVRLTEDSRKKGWDAEYQKLKQ